jgi:hypothetical protein
MLKMATDIPIKSLMSEFESLEPEIKKRRAELKKLTSRMKEIKEKILLFLKEKNQPGVKDQYIALVSEKVDRVKRKNKSEIKQRTLNVLLNYMDGTKAEKLCKEIEESKKADVEKKEVLKKYDNKK